MYTKKMVKKYLGTGKIAKLFGVSPRTVAKWIDTGLMQGIKIPGSSHRRVTISELNRFSVNHNIPFVYSEQNENDAPVKFVKEPDAEVVLAGLSPDDDFLGRKEV